MFNVVTPFPDLLIFSFFAAFLLRLALGVYVLSLGIGTKKEAAQGKPIFRTIFTLAGISLIIGLYLQISALVVAILFSAALFWKKTSIAPEASQKELCLLIVIALSLLLTGAGPLAFDLPF